MGSPDAGFDTLAPSPYDYPLVSRIRLVAPARFSRNWDLAGWPSQFLLWLTLLGLTVALVRLPLELAAGLIAGGGFTTLALVRPVWVLVVLPLAVPFGSIADVRVGPAQVGGTEVLVGLFFAVWLARGVARRELRLEVPPLLLPLGLWLGVQALSVLGSLSLGSSLKELIKWGEVAALYVVAAQELRRRDIVLVVAVLLLAGALAGAHGLLQALLRTGPPGFLFPLAGRLWLRAYGTFLQPNPYAGYLGVTLPLASGIAAVLLGLGGGTTHLAVDQNAAALVRRGAILAYTAVTGGLMILGLFFSLSRGGWIGAGVAMVAVGILLSRRALLTSLVGGTAGVLFLAFGGAERLPAALRERATDFLPYLGLVDIRRVEITDANFAVIERLAHWWAAARMFSDRPWLGVGTGNYAAIYPAYALPRWPDPLGHAHNFYLNVAAETGLVGLTAYLAFWFVAFVLTWQAVRRTAGLWRGIAVGCLGAFIHLATHNVFDNLYVHGIYLQIALLLAIITVLARPEKLLPPQVGGQGGLHAAPSRNTP